MHNRRGFTLIELLVTIAIIGLLATLGIVAFNTARIRARDARRTSDIRAIQTALEIFRGSVGGYPDDTVSGAGGSAIGGGNLRSLTRSGWGGALPAGVAVYLGQAPNDPAPGGSGQYTYTSRADDGSSCDATPCDTYVIQFSLEQGTGGLSAGTYCASPPGTINAGACP